jgi:hypothetical protein
MIAMIKLDNQITQIPVNKIAGLNITEEQNGIYLTTKIIEKYG